MRNKKLKKKTPLTKGQTRLLDESLRKLLGYGLIKDAESKKNQINVLLLKDALNIF
jgi:hypothetical protein